MKHYKLTFRRYDIPYDQTFLVRAENAQSAILRFHRDCKAKVVKIETVQPQRGEVYADAD